jgi:hypothetical protein
MNVSSAWRSRLGSSASIYPKYVEVLYVYGSSIFGMTILISAISLPELFSLDEMRNVFLLYFLAAESIIGACFSPDADTTTTSVIDEIFASLASISDSVAKKAPRFRKRIRPV